ncbi:energy-coupled thiamine transporter ThiT [Clostridium sp. BJN0001]|uniref:energy-coupled thiamine transporter ThiT n=1 Tax=Clostridium sp. BJN0001 TaxID=2930219 RepID=UPI001FD2EB9E|nr:energy-coupled thiamine transporter ThiT [Clostridium sp. BJN0001]
MNILSDWGVQISKTISNIPQGFSQIGSNLTSIIALVGVLLILLLLLKVNKTKFTPQLMTRIGIALALATILKILRLYHFPQGGSITLGSMVPILIIAFMYGPYVGCFTGFLFGIITFFLDPYILHPIQVLFDYPLPFTALGIAGFFRLKKYRWVGGTLAIVLRFICHFISGVAFFGSFAPEGMSPAIYSLFVNGPFMAVEGIICLVIMSVLPIDRIINNSK